VWSEEVLCPFSFEVCTRTCSTRSSRVPRVVPCLALVKVACLSCCVLDCVCALWQKVNSAFSKMRIKQLKHHLIPISQKPHSICRWFPGASRGPPASGTLQPLMQEYTLTGKTILRKSKK